MVVVSLYVDGNVGRGWGIGDEKRKGDEVGYLL